MAKLPSNLVQDSMKPYNSKEYYPKKAKGISFWAFILSIFAYSSIFYVFNLSFSSLFNNTKFWFAISNTLILIIAADYGAFASSKDKQDHLYQEYMMHSQARSASSFDSQYPPIVEKGSCPSKQLEVYNMKAKNVEVPEKTVEVPIAQNREIAQEKTVEAPLAQNREIAQEKTVEAPLAQNREIAQEKSVVHVSKGHDLDKKRGRENVQAETYMRSKSEKTKRVVIDESKNKLIRRSKSTDQKDKASAEDNEFSTMSDEELNRRVEQFIQRTNRQIRLESARTFHQELVDLPM